MDQSGRLLIWIKYLQVHISLINRIWFLVDFLMCEYLVAHLEDR